MYPQKISDALKFKFTGKIIIIKIITRSSYYVLLSLMLSLVRAELWGQQLLINELIFARNTKIREPLI
jgi:hypothetical protein